MKKTKLISILTAFVLLVTTFTLVAYAKETNGATKGDVNIDGKFSVLDAKWILQNVAGTRKFNDEQTKNADVNNDGDITVLDAKWVLQIVSGLRDENGVEKPTTTKPSEPTTTKPSDDVPPPPPHPTEPAGEKKGPDDADEHAAKCPYPIGSWTTREGFEGFYSAINRQTGIETPSRQEASELIAAHPYDTNKYCITTVYVGYFDNVGIVSFVYIREE